MANFSDEVHARKRITTYGKTRRKIAHGSVFNNLTREATTKYTNRNPTKNELWDNKISADITLSNSQKSDSSFVLPKDIYDFPSDEDTQNSEVVSQSRLEPFQESKLPGSIQENHNQRTSSATSSKLRGKSVPNEYAKPKLMSKTNESSELADETSNESRFKKHVCIRRTSKLIRSISDSHSNLEIHEKKSIDQESCTGTSDLPENEKENLKRKYAAVSLKTHPCRMSPRSSSLSSSMSKTTGIKEKGILEIPVNDDNMILLRSSSRGITKTSDLNLRRKFSPVAARVKENGKNIGPSTLDNKDNMRDLLPKIHSSPTKESICQERIRYKSKSTSLHPQKTEKKRQQKQSKIGSAIKLEKVKEKSGLTSSENDPDVMVIEPKISSENHCIWKDLLGSANNDDDDQDVSEIPKIVRQKNPKLSTLQFDANQLESQEVANIPCGNFRRLRMIDSLVQKNKNYSSPDQLSIEELESGKESCAISIASFVSPNRSRSHSVESELLSSQLVAQESQSSVSSLGIGTKITYSRQRSMLAEEDLAKDLAFDLFTPNQDSARKRCRRGSVPKLKPLSSFHDDEDEEENSQVVIKSVHELRKSGATKLFVDECTDLFDRINSPGEANSVRRSGLLDLASKMMNQNFVQQYLANSMEQQLFVNLNKEKDVISGFLIMSILIVLLMEGPIAHLISFLCRNGITKLIIDLLDFELGIPRICKDRKINMSKLSQSLLIEYHNLFLKSPILHGQEHSMISPRTIVLICLKKLTHQSREAENSYGLFSEDLVTKLFAIMKLTSSEKLLESTNNEVSIDLSLTVQCLQLHYTAPYNILDKNKWINQHLPLLTDILEMTLSREFFQAHIEILKITLQVTNQNPFAIEVFVRPSLILSLCKKFVSQFNILNEDHTEAQFSLVLDHLSLILGVLMNFSESNQRVGECLQDFEYSDEDPLKDMITIFQENSENISQAESEQEVLKNVVLGYLSVTLGYLFLHPPIGNRLEDVKIKLLGCIEEFILIHKLADGKLVDESNNSQILTELNGEEDQIEAHKELTERLERLVKRLKFHNPHRLSE